MQYINLRFTYLLTYFLQVPKNIQKAKIP